ncbi:elongation factor 2 [Tanacetum coccineum]|uniref:Elongation factor 2 n=1 Tax=Tanacetum coccineum TaxID=301880 RepID=A0ABQ5AZ16_9ASTR
MDIRLYIIFRLHVSICSDEDDITFVVDGMWWEKMACILAGQHAVMLAAMAGCDETLTCFSSHGNILSLQDKLGLEMGVKDVSQVSQEKLLSLVANCLNKENEDQRINPFTASDLLHLATPITVNIGFNRCLSIDDIVPEECDIFRLLKIPLYHGSIVDPQDSDTFKAIGSKSYDELAIELATLKSLKDLPQTIAEPDDSSPSTADANELVSGEKCIRETSTLRNEGEAVTSEKLNKGCTGDDVRQGELIPDVLTSPLTVQGSMVIQCSWIAISKKCTIDTHGISRMRWLIQISYMQLPIPPCQQLPIQQQQQQPQQVSPTTSLSGLVAGPQVKLSAEDLERMMGDPHNIRNVSVIGHFGHGKSTLTYYLVAAAGLIAPDDVTSDTGMPDTDHREAERVVTTKLSGQYVHYEMNEAAGKRGGECETETVLRQRLCENLRPVLLTVNKMNKCLLELDVDNDEDVYMMLKGVVDDTNAVLRDAMVSPVEGTVAFSSVLYGWAFTLTTFSEMYGYNELKLRNRLWGDNYYDRKKRKWTNYYTGAASCARGFVQFCYLPIKSIMKACLNNQKDSLWPLLKKYKVELKDEEKEFTGEKLMKCVMQNWLPAATALLEMSILHLPSPYKAQVDRVANLYQGPIDDPYANGVESCNSHAPLLLYVCKMMPAHVKGDFFAFGRVFSGTVRSGSTVTIMGPDDVNDTKIVQRTAILMRKKQVTMGSVPCGNTVALFGLDLWVTNNATIPTEMEGLVAHRICDMKFSVLPFLFVQVTVNCEDLHNLSESLKRLLIFDPSVAYTQDNTKFFVAGNGEFHLQISKNYLEDLMGGVEIKFSELFVSYHETVLKKSVFEESSRRMTNGQNLFCMEARPLEDGLAEAINDGEVNFTDGNDIADILESEFEWDRGLATNVYSIVAWFQEASKRGCLAEEPVRGICYNLLEDADRCDYDVQILNKAIGDSQRTAHPRLLEPKYIFKILVPETELGGVCNVINERDGHVYEETYIPGHPYHKLRGYIAMRKSIGFLEDLGAKTKGQALLQCLFDHWDIIEADPFDQSSVAGNLVRQIRKRKGLEAFY